MEQINYKSEIEQSRIGSLGSSDAALVERVGRFGISALTDTDKFRLAVLKGQAVQPQIKTPAMELGDKIEQTIYKSILVNHPEAISNPRHEDELFSNYYGFGIINHIDIEVVEGDKVTWYEVKASKHTTEEVMDTYAAQLQWHWMLLKKVYYNQGKQLELKLVHYKTDVTETFSASNIIIKSIEDNLEIENKFYGGFGILKDYLPTFEYQKPEEMSIRLVGDEQVQTLRDAAEAALIQIATLQKQIDDFKDALKTYMEENGIKKIYSDNYSVTLILPSVAMTFDSKRFKTEQPELYKEYLKETERASSVKITVK